MTAAIECLKFIIKNIDPTLTKNITIFLDSSNTLNIMTGLINPRHNKKLGEYLQELYRQAKATHNITTLWIPGHEGIEGNEIADYGTNLAAVGIFSTIRTNYENLTQQQLMQILGWRPNTQTDIRDESIEAPLETIEIIKAIQSGAIDSSVLKTKPTIRTTIIA